mmetsp:Transcript_49295/g.72307  ORF Transcript_49295/g.72307 Transcript_49295/m.72307 type:complete len:110 (-) Transcript_49295:1490-1819(-)
MPSLPPFLPRFFSPSLAFLLRLALSISLARFSRPLALSLSLSLSLSGSHTLCTHTHTHLHLDLPAELLRLGSTQCFHVTMLYAFLEHHHDAFQKTRMGRIRKKKGSDQR